MSENNGIIPGYWVWSTMSDACEKIQDGTHFSPHQDKQLPKGQYPYVTAKNVRPSGLDLTNITYLAEDEHRQIYQRCDPHSGDVLLVKDGVNTGDAAINTVEGEISLLSSVCMLRPRKAIIAAEFLRYFILSPQGYRSLTGQMTGTAIKRIILRKVRETPVPIAPIDEQRRIVAKIEELFSDLDAGVAALERAKANLKRYRAAVLKAAVEGKLTERWRAEHPNTEPASKLLERILTKRRKNWEADQLAKFAAAGKIPPKNWRAKYFEPAPPDISDLPELPERWGWVSLDSLCCLIADIDHNMPKSVDAGVKFLSAKDLLDDGTLNLTRDVKLISESDYARLSRKVQPQRNDIIYSRIGARLGKARLVESDERFLVSYSCCTIRTLVIRSRFLARYLDCGFVLARAMANTQSIGVPDLGLDRIKRFAVPLCSIDEQDQIISEVEQRLSIIAVAEVEIDHSLLRAARLRQSILKQAFEGKLVPQDPQDEPASVLLERLSLSRSAHEVNGKPRKIGRQVKSTVSERGNG